MSGRVGGLLRRWLKSAPEPVDAPPYPFIAHNVRLDNGRETKADVGATMDQFPVFRAVVRMLKLVYPEGIAGKSIVDIGCLEGGYTVEFARLGMVATGLDVRRSNIETCLWVKDRCNLPNLNFVRDDAGNLDAHGPFDIVFMNGLLYHLDQPRKMMESVARQCRKAAFVHTHFTHAHRTQAVDDYHLSEPEENEGLRGRWYRDHDPMEEAELDRELRGSSWANHRSFWLQKEELLRLIGEVGFALVLEQYDHLDAHIAWNMREGPYMQKDRSMFVGIKV